MFPQNKKVGFETPFQSFWMGGFECADHQNAFGNRIDMIRLTGHDLRLEEDYRNLLDLGISTVREGIRWSDVEKAPYRYDWTYVEKIIRTSSEIGIQVLWDICHFGFPDDLTPLHPMFARRFAHLCRAFVEKYRSLTPNGPLIITPINEVSFLSWLGGDVRGTSPYCINMGWEVKYRLMKAFIEGVEVMKSIDSEIMIMTTEPLINVCKGDSEDENIHFLAAQKHQAQFQVLEMLTGKICPELGGRPEFLDLIGVNFYFNNQSVYDMEGCVPWGENPAHPSWRPLHSLIDEVYERFGKPMVIAETSHPGEHRPQWIQKIHEECISILNAGIPLLGCCIYPVIDRPDWDHPEIWHRSGIWDIPDHQSSDRVIAPEYAEVLRDILIPSYST